MGRLDTKLVDDAGLVRVVVMRADSEIMLSPPLFDSIRVHPIVPGCSYRDGVLTIGSHGIGIGIVRYVDTGREVGEGPAAGYRLFTKVPLVPEDEVAT